MGAEYFEDSSIAANVDEAFRECVEAAQYDHGHAGYTGTIAEKDEYVVLDLPAGVDAAEAVRALDAADRGDTRPGWLSQNILAAYRDKWGPAVAMRDGEGWRFVGLASC